MDKSEGKDWFAKTLNNVTEETAKVYKISRLKLETSTLEKSKHEKMNMLARRLLELIKDGKIEAGAFEPEYTSILAIDDKITEAENEIVKLKDSMKIGFGKKDNKKQEPATPEKTEEINEEKKD